MPRGLSCTLWYLFLWPKFPVANSFWLPYQPICKQKGRPETGRPLKTLWKTELATRRERCQDAINAIVAATTIVMIAAATLTAASGVMTNSRRHHGVITAGG